MCQGIGQKNTMKFRKSTVQVQTVVEEFSSGSSYGGTYLDILEVRRFGYLSLATWRSTSRLQFDFLHGHFETIQQNALANFAFLPDACVASMAALFLIASWIVAFVSSLSNRPQLFCVFFLHGQHLFSQFITDCVVSQLNFALVFSDL